VSIIQTNTTGLITHFNRGAEILLGYQAEELVNIHSPQLIHLKDEVMQRGNELSTLYGKEIMGFDVFVEEAKMGRFDSREWSYVRKDGTIFPVQLVVTSIRDRKNFIIGYLGIATDISELKTQHQLIELQRDDLEKLNATKDKFFSIVAHDLKSPLNSLKSFSDLLLTYYDRLTKEDILKMSRELSSSITNTIKMADNLITWAQLQMDDYQFNEDIVSVEEVIASICSVYTDVAMKKDIRLSQSIENSLEILGDKNQIEFIFRNLVNNAIKYTNPNGLVSITAKTLSSGEIEIGVEDNGIGIDENTKSKLFSSYKVRSEKGTAGESGTGLGLMLCQEFVTLNKGEISVDSEPGNGTTFYVRFRKPETERIHT
jgi:PAS domain S-box-containing protein